MSRRLRVEGYTNLERDVHSGGIVNTSRTEYQQFMVAYEKKQTEKQRMQSMCDELNSLKDEMSDIKQMLKQILEK
jgi:hypothetical protein